MVRRRHEDAPSFVVRNAHSWEPPDMSEMQVTIPAGVAPGGRLHVSSRKASAANRVPGRAVAELSG